MNELPPDFIFDDEASYRIYYWREDRHSWVYWTRTGNERFMKLELQILEDYIIGAGMKPHIRVTKNIQTLEYSSDDKENLVVESDKQRLMTI